MGQKVRPTGFRVGVMQPWKSAWYAGKQDFSELLVEDAKIRAFIPTYLARTKDRKEQRPMISDIRIELKTVEITRPEIDPQIVAHDIAEQLERRASFRRTMKQAIERSMENGAKG